MNNQIFDEITARCFLESNGFLVRPDGAIFPPQEEGYEYSEFEKNAIACLCDYSDYELIDFTFK